MIASLTQHLIHAATLARGFVPVTARLGRLPAWLIALAVLPGLNLDLSAAGQESPQRRPGRNASDARVFKDRITPHWFAGNTRFWYCNVLLGGAKEFILVDAERGVRGSAFDHARLAAAFSKAAGTNYSADKLPFESIEFADEAKAVLFEVAGTAWKCDLTSYECSKTFIWTAHTESLKASWNEQWMGYPVGPQYVGSSNIENARRLRGHLLLIVGEMDDNVPPKSTYRFMHALVKAEKDFDLLVVPGGGHGSGGAYAARRREDFFVRHLLGVEPPNRNARSAASN